MGGGVRTSLSHLFPGSPFLLLLFSRLQASWPENCMREKYDVMVNSPVSTCSLTHKVADACQRMHILTWTPGVKPNVSNPWQVPLPAEPSISSTPVLLYKYHCSLYLISYTSLEYGPFVAFPLPLLRTSSLGIFYTINVSQKNAWERFQSGNETSKTVRQNVPFVYISWLTQVVCYSKGRLTSLWSLVLRNTGSSDWLPLLSRLLSFLPCSSSAVSWKFNKANVLASNPSAALLVFI